MPEEAFYIISIDPIEEGAVPRIYTNAFYLDIVLKQPTGLGEFRLRNESNPNSTAAFGFLIGSTGAERLQFITANGEPSAIFIDGGGSGHLELYPLGVLSQVRLRTNPLPSILYTTSVPVGNVGAGPDTLFSYTLIGTYEDKTTLANVGDSLWIRAAGTVAANANSKQLKLIYGTTTLFDTTAQLQSGGDWELDALIMRNAATVQRIICKFTLGATTVLWNTKTVYTTGAEALTDDQVLKIEATTATADNDIVANLMIVEHLPGKV